MGALAGQILETITVLVIFVGLAYLVYVGRLAGAALLFFSDIIIIIGFLANTVAWPL